MNAKKTIFILSIIGGIWVFGVSRAKTPEPQIMPVGQLEVDAGQEGYDLHWHKTMQIMDRANAKIQAKDLTGLFLLAQAFDYVLAVCPNLDTASSYCLGWTMYRVTVLSDAKLGSALKGYKDCIEEHKRDSDNHEVCAAMALQTVKNQE